jgi:hypothetical protein
VLRTREVPIAFAVAACLAVLLTWPTVGRFGSAARIDSVDGRFSVWNVAWVAHALTTDPGRLYDANIFFPHKKALAFSEANLVAGVLAVPVWVLIRNPYAAQNWVILCSFVLSALATYALARRLVRNIAGSAVAAVAFAYCSFTFAHIAHVQLLMTFVLPLSLLAMHRFVEAVSVRRAVELGGAVALAGLACGYYGLFSGLAVGLGLVWFSVESRRYRELRYWGLGLLAAAVAAAMVAPFFIPYLEVRADGFGRTLDEARIYSVRWRSYLASPMLVNRWMLPLIERWREVLFPGFFPLALATIGVVAMCRNRSEFSALGVSRRVMGFYVTLAALAVWASLGPDGGLYSGLYYMIPLFSMLRAPARFGVLLTLSSAVLAAVGFAVLERRTPARRRPILLAGIAVVAVVRSTVGPLALTDAPPVAKAYKRVANLPWGPVAEFPYFSGSGDWPRQTMYMLMSVPHFKPLINGYSDHIPRQALADASALASFPDASAWRVLRARRARYVLVHWKLYNPDRARAIQTKAAALRPHLRTLVDDPDVSLFEITSWPDVDGAVDGSVHSSRASE